MDKKIIIEYYKILIEIAKKHNYTQDDVQEAILKIIKLRKEKLNKSYLYKVLYSCKMNRLQKRKKELKLILKLKENYIFYQQI